jgi:hypothetical protein
MSGIRVHVILTMNTYAGHTPSGYKSSITIGGALVIIISVTVST